jgi:hypothetical protein
MNTQTERERQRQRKRRKILYIDIYGPFLKQYVTLEKKTLKFSNFDVSKPHFLTLRCG